MSVRAQDDLEACQELLRDDADGGALEGLSERCDIEVAIELLQALLFFESDEERSVAQRFFGEVLDEDMSSRLRVAAHIFESLFPEGRKKLGAALDEVFLRSVDDGAEPEVFGRQMFEGVLLLDRLLGGVLSCTGELCRIAMDERFRIEDRLLAAQSLLERDWLSGVPASFWLSLPVGQHPEFVPVVMRGLLEHGKIEEAMLTPATPREFSEELKKTVVHIFGEVLGGTSFEELTGAFSKVYGRMSPWLQKSLRDIAGVGLAE